MRRDVKTVQRWEKREGMPVHRHVHDRMGSVYAFRHELDAWAQNRRLTAETLPAALEPAAVLPGLASRAPRRRWLWICAGAAGALALTIALSWPGEKTPNLSSARFQPLTDFPGIEQAVAISRDGRLAAFLSDRDGTMDVWITQVGTGEFYNLTKGAARDIVNPSVYARSTSVRFHTRHVLGAPARHVPPVRRSACGRCRYSVVHRGSISAAPPSSTGATTERGSCITHRGPGTRCSCETLPRRRAPDTLLSAPPGLHSHFPVWSPDGAFIYFVQGTVPDRMDIWRLRPTGGAPERITSHDGVVTYPVFLNRRTLAYAASDRDGSGPWLHTVDVEQRVPRRVSVGVDRITSLAASRDGRRLVASVSSPKERSGVCPLVGSRSGRRTRALFL